MAAASKANRSKRPFGLRITYKIWERERSANQWYATERARTDARNSMKHGRGGYRTKYIVRIEDVER